MDLLNKIPPTIFLLVSLAFITTGIGILFIGKFIFAAVSLLMGIFSLVAWTFYGLFEETKDT